MLFDLFIKYVITPENILGLLWYMVTIVGMCLIFKLWQEKWWKSLIPIYGTYIIYKHTWKQHKWLFLVQLACNVLQTKSVGYMRKYIVMDIYHTIMYYVENGQLDVDISVGKLLFCLICAVISALAVFLLTRITYVRICSSLQIHNGLLMVGTFLIPEIFLLIDYWWVVKQEK